jgi:ferredoxin
MSSPERFTRRTLLDLLRPARPKAAPQPVRQPPPAPPRAAPPGGFSLAAFSVQVRQSTCLAWQGSFCTVCSERCPVEGALRLEQGRPIIEPSACTGCGVCIQVCPAPINGLMMSPRPAPAAATVRSSEVP